jgi:hypothetical protein
MFRRLIFALALVLCITSPVLADDYTSDYENVFTVATDMNWPVTSAADFGFASGGTGAWGNGWGVTNGRQSVYSGATVGAYKGIFIQSSSSFFRAMSLSIVPTKFKIRLGPPSATPLDQKFQIWGILNTTAITTQLAVGGGAQCVCFRIDSGGGAGVIEAVNKNGVAETVTSTGTFDVAGVDHEYEIIATSAQTLFYMDGTLVATHTTNIPLGALGGVYGIRTKVAAMRVFEPDWLKFEGPR